MVTMGSIPETNEDKSLSDAEDLLLFFLQKCLVQDIKKTHYILFDITDNCIDSIGEKFFGHSKI